MQNTNYLNKFSSRTAMQTQDELFDMLFDQDEVTWQTMLYDLVKSDQMDPWDINISLLAQRFLDTVHQLRKTDFIISGRIVLAAAVLLRIKSKRLVTEDMLNLDRLINPPEEEEGLLDELTDEFAGQREVLKGVDLIPRTPQPRKRKISIYDLVDALQKAMDVKKRRVMRDIPSIEIKIPEKKVDISELIRGVYGKIRNFFAKQNKTKLTFNDLVPSDTKEDKVFTFIPLLHLENERKIDLRQQRHFGEIHVEMLKHSIKKELDKELAES